jgi:hypothetical protein
MTKEGINIARAIVFWIAGGGTLYVAVTKFGITTLDGAVASVFGIASILGGLYFASR